MPCYQRFQQTLLLERMGGVGHAGLAHAQDIGYSPAGLTNPYGSVHLANMSVIQQIHCPLGRQSLLVYIGYLANRHPYERHRQ